MTTPDWPRMWRWRILGPVRPRLTTSVTLAHAARAMLIRTAKRNTGSPLLPFSLHGGRVPREDAPTGVHHHAFYLPEDLDRDGLIDHLTVFAACGFDDESLQMLGDARVLELHSGPSARRLKLVTVRVGDRDEGPATKWRSLTPFVAPVRKRADPGRTARGALQQLIAARLDDNGTYLPNAVVREVDGGALGTSLSEHGQFSLGKRFPRSGEAAVPLRGWFEITFEMPVRGPLAFGFQEHFGLGRFVPAD